MIKRYSHVIIVLMSSPGEQLPLFEAAAVSAMGDNNVGFQIVSRPDAELDHEAISALAGANICLPTFTSSAELSVSSTAVVPEIFVNYPNLAHGVVRADVSHPIEFNLTSGSSSEPGFTISSASRTSRITLPLDQRLGTASPEALRASNAFLWLSTIASQEALRQLEAPDLTWKGRTKKTWDRCYWGGIGFEASALPLGFAFTSPVPAIIVGGIGYALAMPGMFGKIGIERREEENSHHNVISLAYRALGERKNRRVARQMAKTHPVLEVAV